MTDTRKNIENMRRKADQMCTAHACLRDRYSYNSSVLDIIVLILSTWSVSIAFVDPVINLNLTPGDISPTIWVGFLSAFVFFLTLLQSHFNWKGRSEAHQRTLRLYQEAKVICVEVLNLPDPINNLDADRVNSKYLVAGEFGADVSEKDFLTLKKKHKCKVELSKHLDKFPFASILLTKIKLTWRDN